MRIVVEPYSPLWASQFKAIEKELKEALAISEASYLGIEHVGSTAVPGLAAKPRIDVDIVVSDINVHGAIAALERSGQYEVLGELGIPGRYALKYIGPAGTASHPERNVYVCVEGCQSLRNHLAVRDLCRANSRVRDEYARVKLDLSQREWESVDAYCEAKNEVIAWMLTQAGMASEVDAIKGLNSRAAGIPETEIKTVESLV